jgi:hypothetical protein
VAGVDEAMDGVLEAREGLGFGDAEVSGPGEVGMSCRRGFGGNVMSGGVGVNRRRPCGEGGWHEGLRLGGNEPPCKMRKGCCSHKGRKGLDACPGHGATLGGLKRRTVRDLDWGYSRYCGRDT